MGSDGRPRLANSPASAGPEATASASTKRLSVPESEDGTWLPPMRQFQEAHRLAKLGHWQWDSETGEVVLSEETRALFRLPERLTTIDNVLGMVHPEDSSIMLEAMEEARTTGSARARQLRLVDPTDQVHHVIGTASLAHQKSSGGRVIFGVVQDITESVQARERARRHIQELELLSRTATEFLHAAPDADLYALAADELDHIVGEHCVFTLCEVTGTSVRVRAQRNIDAIAEHAPAEFELMKQLVELEEIPGAITPEIAAILAENRLVRIPAGYRGLGHDDGPVASVLEATQRSFRLRDVYLMGICVEGETVAGALMSLDEDAPPMREPLVEAFLRQATAAFARRRSADELAAAQQQLRQSQ